MSKYYTVQGIYALVNVNKPNELCPFGTPYVGQACGKPSDRKFTMGVAQRLCAHRNKLRKGKHCNQRLQRAWNKYGEESFIYLLLERVPEKQLLTEREQFWMDSWRSCESGYNCQNAKEPLGFRRRTLLTFDIIKDWINKYYSEHGKYPSSKSDKIEYAPKNEPISWAGLCVCLMGGFRGLPGGLTLSDFIFKELGIVTRKHAKKISEDDVKGWIENYYKTHGYYPTNKTHDLVECDKSYGKIAWRVIDVLLRKGQRGLPGNSSLRKFIENYAINVIKFKCWYRKANNGQ